MAKNLADFWKNSSAGKASASRRQSAPVDREKDRETLADFYYRAQKKGIDENPSTPSSRIDRDYLNGISSWVNSTASRLNTYANEANKTGTTYGAGASLSGRRQDIDSLMATAQEYMDYLQDNEDAESVLGTVNYNRLSQSVQDTLADLMRFSRTEQEANRGSMRAVNQYLATEEGRAQIEPYLQAQEEAQEAAERAAERSKGASALSSAAMDMARQALQTKRNDTVRELQSGFGTDEYNAAFERMQRLDEGISGLDTAIDNARKQESLQRWSTIMDRPDFAEYSQRGAEIHNDPAPMNRYALWNPTGWWGETFGPDVGNVVTYMRDNADTIRNSFAPVWAQGGDGERADTFNPISMMNREHESPLFLYTQMTEEEVSIYNYLLAHDQEDGTNEAAQYLEDLTPTLTERQAQVDTRTAQMYASEHPVAASAGSVAASLYSPLSYAEAVGNRIAGQETDPYGLGQMISRLPRAARSQVAVDIQEDVTDTTGNEAVGDTVSWLYDIGMSILDNAAVMTVGGALGGAGRVATNVLNFGNAASSMYQDAIDRGASENQAVAAGGAAGLAEMFFERFSIDSFLKAASPAAKNALVKNVIRQMGVEASEEGLTEISNIITDTLIMQDLSNYQLALDEYTTQGMDESEARLRVFGDLALQVGESALGGALSGGVMGTAGTAISAGRTRSMASKAIRTNSVDLMIDQALTLDPSSASYTLAQQLRNGDMDSASSGDVARLVRAMAQEEALTPEIMERINTPVQEDTEAETDAQTPSEDDPLLREAQAMVEEVAQEQRARTARTETPSAAVRSAPAVTAATQEAPAAARRETPSQTAQAPRREAPRSGGTKTTPRRKNAQKAIADALERARTSDTQTEITSAHIPAVDAQTNEQIEIAGVDEVSPSGAVTLRADDGSVLAYSDVQFSDPRVKQLYDSVSALRNTNAARTFVSSYDADAGISVSEYASGFYPIYNAAIEGESFEAALARSGKTAALSPAQQQAAYMAGQNIYNIAQESRAREEAEVAAKKQQEAPKKQRKKKAKQPAQETSAAEAPTQTQRTETRRKGGVSYEIDESALTDRQRAGLENAREVESVIDALARLGGAEVVIVPHIGHEGGLAQGAYLSGTNLINLSLETEDPIEYVAMHELTHYIRSQDEESYYTLLDIVSRALTDGGEDVNALVKAQMDRFGYDGDEALEEVVCNTIPAILSDSAYVDQLARADKTLAERIRDFFVRLVDTLKTHFQELSSDAPFEHTRTLVRNIDALEEIERVFDASLAKIARENGELTEIDQTAAMDDTNIFAAVDAQPTSTDAGVVIDEGGVRYSINTRDAWAEHMRKAYGSGEDVQAAIRFVDNVSEHIMENEELRDYMVRGDIPYNKTGPIRSNVEYKITFDLDTLCQRVWQYAATRDQIIDQIGRPLSKRESRQLIDYIEKMGGQIPCRYCYVEGKRALFSDSYLNYLNFRRDVLNEESDDVARTKMYSYNPKTGELGQAAQKVFDNWRGIRGGEDLYNPQSLSEHYRNYQQLRNAVLDWLEQNTSGDVEQTRQSEDGLTFLHYELRNSKGRRSSAIGLSKQVLRHFGAYSGADANARASFIARKIITPWLQARYEGVESVRNTPGSKFDARVLDLERLANNYASSASSAHLFEPYQPYTDQLSLVKRDILQYVNAMGGVRIHSSNDFQVRNIVDYLQFFSEMAEMGLMSHSYTKDLNFAELAGRLGGRVNVSIAMDGDFSTGIQENFSEGVPWAAARALQKRNPNVGVMAMVTNDDQLSFVLNTDWVQMTIPFHSSGLESEYTDALRWTSYQSIQNERPYSDSQMRTELKAAGVDVPANLSGRELRELYAAQFGKTLLRDRTGKYITPHFFPHNTQVTTEGGGVAVIPGHHNDAQRYLELCSQYAVRPRFDGARVQDRDGNIINAPDHPNYVKLIKETARTDSEQTPISLEAFRDPEFLEWVLKLIDNNAIPERDSSVNFRDVLGIVPTFIRDVINNPDAKSLPYGQLPEALNERVDVMNEFNSRQREVYTERFTGGDPIRGVDYEIVSGPTRLAQPTATMLARADETGIRYSIRPGGNQNDSALDRAKHRIKEERYRGRWAVAEERQRLGQEYQARRDRDAARAKEHMEERLDKQREEYQQRLANQAAAFREREARQRAKRNEAAERRRYRERIQASAKTLSDWLAAPSDKRFVPEYLRNAVAQYVANIDVGYRSDTKARQKWTDRMVTMLDAVRRASTAPPEATPDLEFDSETLANIEELTTILRNAPKNKAQQDMTVEEMKMLSDTLQAIKHQIINADKLFVNGRRESIATVGEDTIDRALGKKNKRHNDALKKVFGNRMAMGIMKPYYFFREMGGNLRTLGDDLFRGESDWAQIMKQERDWYEGIKKKYHVDRWANRKNDELKFTAGDGERVSLTREQAMYIYAVDNRERLESGTNHLRGGGIVTDLDRRGRPKDDSTAHALSNEDIQRISDWLTDEQKAYADELVSNLSTTMAAYGNRTSMRLVGYKKFTGEHYIPIRVHGDYVQSEVGSDSSPGSKQTRQSARLKNRGFTKSIAQGANNPLVAADITDVWARHVQDMASYAALAIQQDNLIRVYNYKRPNMPGAQQTTVKSALTTGYGRYTRKYLDRLNADIGGTVMVDPRDSLMSTMLSRFKKGAVLGSLSVAIQQPTAYLRALAVLPARDMRPGGLGAFREAQRYAGTAIIKDIGGFDMQTGGGATDWLRGSRPQNIVEWADEIGGILPEKADAITWGAIWNSVKQNVRRTTKLKPGSQEFFQECGKRFDNVVRMTQVYDSTLSRADFMRGKTQYLSMVTSFMAEPMTSMNLLIDSIYHQKDKRMQGRVSVRAAAVAFVASTIVNAVAKSVVYAMRDDDDELTFWEKYQQELRNALLGEPNAWIPGAAGQAVGFLTGSDLSPLGQLPIISDVASMVQGYDVSRTDMDAISRVVSAAQALLSDNRTTYYKIREFVGAVSTLVGVPVRNLWRDVEGIARTIGVPVPATSTNESTQTGSFQRAYQALIDGDKTAYQRYMDRAEQMIRDSMDERVEEDGVTYLNYEVEVQNRLVEGLRDALKEDPRIQQMARYVSSENWDLDQYERMRAQLIREGFPEAAITGAVNSARNDIEDTGEIESTPYGPDEWTRDDLQLAIEDAIQTGDMSDVEAIQQDMLTQSDTYWQMIPQAPEDYVKSAARKAYQATGVSSNDRNALQVLEMFGYTQEDVVGWEQDEMRQTMYDFIDSGDYRQANQQIAKMRNSGMDADGIRDGVRTKYKKLIQEAQVAGDTQRVRELRSTLMNLNLYTSKGSVYFTSTMIDEWIRDAGKTE